jgi:hypothetical protein
MKKPTNWMLGITLAGLVALAGAGCKKAEPAVKVPTYHGVQVDMPKLQKALQGAGQEAQTGIRNVRMGLRYGRYADALTKLEALKELPGLTDAQKQVISEVGEQIKQAAQSLEAAKAAKAAQ